MHHLKNVMVQGRRFASGGHGHEVGRPVTLEQMKKMVPSALTYGAVGACLGLYLTDWKLVLQYLPFYNSKFEKKD